MLIKGRARIELDGWCCFSEKHQQRERTPIFWCHHDRRLLYQIHLQTETTVNLGYRLENAVFTDRDWEVLNSNEYYQIMSIQEIDYWNLSPPVTA